MHIQAHACTHTNMQLRYNTTESGHNVLARLLAHANNSLATGSKGKLLESKSACTGILDR